MERRSKSQPSKAELTGKSWWELRTREHPLGAIYREVKITKPNGSTELVVSQGIFPGLARRRALRGKTVVI